MVAWRTMEAPILLALLMLGFVAYLGLAPWLLDGQVSALPILAELSAPVPVVTQGVEANPVEQIMVPRHSIWAQ